MKRTGIFSFLNFRLYRRTFIIYLAVTLVLITGISAVLMFNAHKTGLNNFSATADSVYTNVDMKRESVISGIDRLFFRIYSYAGTGFLPVLRRQAGGLCPFSAGPGGHRL